MQDGGADATASLSPTQQRVTAAFSADGFDVERWITNLSGILTRSDGSSLINISADSTAVGCVARHRTATNYRTGQKKTAYYVEGTAYEMGVLGGLLTEPDAEIITTTYLERFVPQLLDYNWSESIQNTSAGRELFKFIGSFIIEEANRSWCEQAADGVWPNELVRRHA